MQKRTGTALPKVALYPFGAFGEFSFHEHFSKAFSLKLWKRCKTFFPQIYKQPPQESYRPLASKGKRK